MAPHKPVTDKTFVMAWVVMGIVLLALCTRELARIGLAEGGATFSTLGGIVFAIGMIIAGWNAARGRRLAIQISIGLSVLALVYVAAFLLLIGRHFGPVWFVIAILSGLFFAWSIVFLRSRLRSSLT